MVEMLLAAAFCLGIAIQGEILEDNDLNKMEDAIERKQEKLDNQDKTNEGWIWHHNSPLKKERRLQNQAARKQRKLEKKKAKLERKQQAQ